MKSKWIITAAVTLLVAFIGFSSPGEVVIDVRGKPKGIVNEIRAVFQGNKFMKDQLVFARKQLRQALDEPAKQAAIDKEMEPFFEELRQDEEQFYKDNPDLRPTAAEIEAEKLRRRADEIEQAEFDRMLEDIRKDRIAELVKIIRFLETKIK